MTYRDQKAEAQNAIADIEKELRQLREELVVMSRRNSFANMQDVLNDFDEIVRAMEGLDHGIDELRDEFEAEQEHTYADLVQAAEQVLPSFSEDEPLTTHRLRMALWDARQDS